MPIRVRFLWPCGIVALACAAALSCSGSDPFERVLERSGHYVAAALDTLEIPSDHRIERIAVMAFDGKSGDRAADAVETALVQAGRFAVVDRKDLQKLVQEQAVSQTDLFDKAQELRLEACDGLLVGVVRDADRSVGEVSLRAKAKLVSVVTGRILWQDEYVITQNELVERSRSPVVSIVAGALVLIVIVAGGARWLRKRSASQGAKERFDLARSLGAVIGLQERCAVLLTQQGPPDAATEAGRLLDEMKVLRRKVEMRPRSRQGSAQQQRDFVDKTEKLQGEVQHLQQAIHEDASTGIPEVLKRIRLALSDLAFADSQIGT